MNMKVTSTALQILLFSILCNGALFSSASAEQSTIDLFDTPFDHCFEHGYHLDAVTQDQAFATAQCFTNLLSSESDVAALGASVHTIRQYAASWYSAAAAKGHALALAQISKQLIALNQLEQTLHSRITDAQWQLLAADTTFKTLDINRDGALSPVEVAAAGELKSGLLQGDLDQDGLLSLAEYTVHNGEATASGRP